MLTDEEITLIVRECARGSAINRDGSTSHRIARAIEAAVLAKLREQKPVAFYDGNKFYANEESAICGCADMAKLKPVFTHPAPIPEVKDAFPQSHRLALELECLILSCKDTVAVSKWWDSANEALDQWREFNEAARSE